MSVRPEWEITFLVWFFRVAFGLLFVVSLLSGLYVPALIAALGGLTVRRSAA